MRQGVWWPVLEVSAEWPGHLSAQHVTGRKRVWSMARRAGGNHGAGGCRAAVLVAVGAF